MIIDDQRQAKKELKFDELENGKVYISHRYQAYVMYCSDVHISVNLENGLTYDDQDHKDDVFEPVKATLVVE